MALLQIIASVFTLSEVFAQPHNSTTPIEIEGLGKGYFLNRYLEPMRKIINLIHGKEYEKAIAELTISKGQKVEPFNYRWQYAWLRAFCYLETGNLGSAMIDLRDAKDRDVENMILIDLISIEVFLSARKYTQDIRDAMKHMHYEKLLKLGDRLCSKRKYQDAMQCYSEAFLQFENYPNLHYNCYISRGNCYTRMEKFDLALANFTHAQRSKSSFSEVIGTDDRKVQVLFIHALFGAGFFDKAKERMDDLKCEEDVVLAIRGILDKNENFDEALEFFTRAIDKYPKSGVLYEKRAHNYWRMKKSDKAIEDFRSAIQFDSSLMNSWISLIKALLNAGEQGEAEQVLENFDKLANPILNGTLIAEFEKIRLQILRRV